MQRRRSRADRTRTRPDRRAGRGGTWALVRMRLPHRSAPPTRAAGSTTTARTASRSSWSAPPSPRRGSAGDGDRAPQRRYETRRHWSPRARCRRGGPHEAQRRRPSASFRIVDDVQRVEHAPPHPPTALSDVERPRWTNRRQRTDTATRTQRAGAAAQSRSHDHRGHTRTRCPRTPAIDDAGGRVRPRDSDTLRCGCGGVGRFQSQL